MSTEELYTVVQQPRIPSPKPPLLILLHGYGSNEEDLIGLAPYLDPRLLLVSVRAPHQLMPQAYAWFALNTANHGTTINREQGIAAREQVAAFVEGAAERFGADPNHVYLSGFSQGAILTAAIVLTRPKLLSGAVLMSGIVRPELSEPRAAPEELSGFPIFMAHGTYDNVLAISAARAGRDLLQQLPVDLTYREYPMAHQISGDSIADINSWFAERLS